MNFEPPYIYNITRSITYITGVNVFTNREKEIRQILLIFVAKSAQNFIRNGDSAIDQWQYAQFLLTTLREP